MLYPLFFEPIYKSILWGGRSLEKLFGRKLPSGNVAESWEICCHKNDISVVANGPHTGRTLDSLMTEYSDELIGSAFAMKDRFPLLVKLIDANDRLSVQVHPDDDYSVRIEGQPGKTELWYVMHAKQNARIIYGLKKGVTKADLAKTIKENALESCLNYMPVKQGDAVFIPAGTVHALLDGVVVAEIQQNSDVTYRLFDWNRVSSEGRSRELHIAKALDVISFDPNTITTNTPAISQSGCTITTLVKCRHFNIDKLQLQGSYSAEATGASFVIYTVVEGSGIMCHNENVIPLPLGASVMLPARCSPYMLQGSLSLLKTSI